MLIVLIIHSHISIYFIISAHSSSALRGIRGYWYCIALRYINLYSLTYFTTVGNTKYIIWGTSDDQCEMWICDLYVCGLKWLCCRWGDALHSTRRRQVSSSCRYPSQVWAGSWFFCIQQCSDNFGKQEILANANVKRATAVTTWRPFA